MSPAAVPAPAPLDHEDRLVLALEQQLDRYRYQMREFAAAIDGPTRAHAEAMAKAIRMRAVLGCVVGGFELGLEEARRLRASQREARSGS